MHLRLSESVYVVGKTSIDDLIYGKRKQTFERIGYKITWHKDIMN